MLQYDLVISLNLYERVGRKDGVRKQCRASFSFDSESQISTIRQHLKIKVILFNQSSSGRSINVIPDIYLPNTYYLLFIIITRATNNKLITLTLITNNNYNSNYSWRPVKLQTLEIFRFKSSAIVMNLPAIFEWCSASGWVTLIRFTYDKIKEAMRFDMSDFLLNLKNKLTLSPRNSSGSCQ